MDNSQSEIAGSGVSHSCVDSLKYARTRCIMERARDKACIFYLTTMAHLLWHLIKQFDTACVGLYGVRLLY